MLIRELSETFGPFLQIVLRGFFSALIAWLSAHFLGGGLRLKHLPRKAIVLLGLGYTFSVVLFTLSLETVPVGTAVFFLFSISTSIAFGFDYARRVIARNWRNALALAFSLCGIALASTVSLSGGQDVRGLILALLAGVGEGVANVSRSRLNKVSTDTAIWFQGVCAMVITLPLAYAGRSSLQTPVAIDWVTVVVFGLLLYLAGRLLVYGFGVLQSSRGTQVLSVEVPLAAVVGFLVYQEPVSLSIALGACFLFVSLFLTGSDHPGSPGAASRQPGSGDFRSTRGPVFGPRPP